MNWKIFGGIVIIVVLAMVFIPFNDGFTKRIILRKPRIYLPVSPPQSKNGFLIGAIAGTALSFVLAYFGLPAVLAGIVGFGSKGVISGTLAALWQSYLGGAIASGSTFSLLQSISMGGVGITTYTFLTTIGLISGSQLGTVLIGEKELTVDPQTLEELFDAYDFDEDDFITNSDLKEALRKLEPKILKDLDSRYYKSTNRTLSALGRIKYSDYVKLFNLKVYEGEDLKLMLKGVFVEKKEKKRNIYCQDIKEMLPDLRVRSSEEKIEAACYYVTNGEPDKPLSFIQFLKIFGL